MHFDLGFTLGSRTPDFCYGNNRCAGTGVCWCNGGYYCMTGCATCGWIPHSRTKGFTLLEKVSSSDIQESLNVESLLL